MYVANYLDTHTQLTCGTLRYALLQGNTEEPTNDV